MIVCWMTQVLDHGIAGILGCFLFWMFGIARFETAYASHAETEAELLCQLTARLDVAQLAQLAELVRGL